MNLVDNPLLLTSTQGNLQVMDSLGNFPTVYPGGAGMAPDNYWFLGGPDYGTPKIHLAVAKAFCLMQVMRWSRSPVASPSATEYTMDPWPEELIGIEVDGQVLDQYLRIPHVVHLVTTGGSIPANDTRYYCVTALNFIR